MSRADGPFRASTRDSTGRWDATGPSDARRADRARIFDLLYPSTPRSRAELGRITGLSRTTVSGVVNGMIEEGLIHEIGRKTGAGGSGRRAALLDIDPTRLYAIGVGVSPRGPQGRSIDGAATDLRGVPRNHMGVVSPGPCDIRGIIDAVTRLVDRIRADEGDEAPIGIGVAVPGTDDGLDDGSVAMLRTRLEVGSGIPVTVVADTVGSGMAERFLGGAGPNLMLVKLDDGVDAATFIDGVPVGVGYGEGGRIGHLSLDPEHGLPCPCSRRGCLGTIIGAPALRTRMAVADGPVRNAILHDAGSYLGSAIALTAELLALDDVRVLGPDDVVGGRFIDAAQERLDAMTSSMPGSHTRIRRCRYGADGALRGAAIAAVLRHLMPSTR